MRPRVFFATICVTAALLGATGVAQDTARPRDADQ